VLNVPSKLLTSLVALFVTVPSVLKETTELVADVLVRLNGEPPGTGGVQFCPAAAGPAHPAEVNTPPGIKFKVNVMFGLDEKTIQSASVKGTPTGWEARFRSLMVPEVPATVEKEPVCVNGSTPKLPVPSPAGRKSIAELETLRDPVVFSIPVIGVAYDKWELITSAPAQTAAVVKRLRDFENNGDLR
jgi:hypothetical protein